MGLCSLNICLFSEFLLFDPIKRIAVDIMYKYSVRMGHRMVCFYQNDQSANAARRKVAAFSEHH